MRLPVWLPACLLLAGCASAPALPLGERLDWMAPLEGIEAAAVPARAAGALPLLDLKPGPDFAAFQQGWGTPQGGSQGAPPPQSPPPGSKPPASSTSPSATGSGKEFSRKGMYLSVGVLSSDGEFDFERADETFDIPIVPNLDETTSVEGDGMSFRLGFRTNENFAFELLLDFASYEMTEDIPGVDFDGTIDMFMLGFNGKVYIPIQRVEPYFLFGFGLGAAGIDADYNDGVTFVSTTGSMTAFNFKLGLGTDIYAHRNFAIFLEWALNMGFGFEGGGHSYVGVTSDIVFGAMFRF